MKIRKANRGASDSTTAKEKLLSVAVDLFYNKGIRAVGIEEVVSKAGVAKISLYRSFASKDDLIVAYLERSNEDFWNHMDADVFSKHHTPASKLRGLMDYIQKRTTQPGYRGCPFMNYVGEFADPSHPGHEIVKKNKEEWRRRLLEIAKGLHVSAPSRLADALLALIEGAYGLSQTLRGREGLNQSIGWAAMALVAGSGKLSAA